MWLQYLAKYAYKMYYIMNIAFHYHNNDLASQFHKTRGHVKDRLKED